MDSAVSSAWQRRAEGFEPRTEECAWANRSRGGGVDRARAATTSDVGSEEDQQKVGGGAPAGAGARAQHDWRDLEAPRDGGSATAATWSIQAGALGTAGSRTQQPCLGDRLQRVVLLGRPDALRSVNGE